LPDVKGDLRCPGVLCQLLFLSKIKGVISLGVHLCHVCRGVFGRRHHVFLQPLERLPKLPMPKRPKVVLHSPVQVVIIQLQVLIHVPEEEAHQCLLLFAPLVLLVAVHRITAAGWQTVWPSPGSSVLPFNYTSP